MSIFGRKKHFDIEVDEVPSMDIRSISVTNEKGKSLTLKQAKRLEGKGHTCSIKIRRHG